MLKCPQTWLAASRPGGGGGRADPSTEGTTTRLAAPQSGDGDGGGGGGREAQPRRQAPEGQQGRGVSNGSNTPPRVSQSRITGPRGLGARPAGGRRAPNGAEASSRPRTTVFNGIRRAGGARRGVGGGGGGGGGAWGGANKGRGRDSQAAGAEGAEAGAGQTLKELVMFDQILSQVIGWAGLARGPAAGSVLCLFLSCRLCAADVERSGRTLVAVFRAWSVLVASVTWPRSARNSICRSFRERPGPVVFYLRFS